LLRQYEAVERRRRHVVADDGIVPADGAAVGRLGRFVAMTADRAFPADGFSPP
jgi:hypothetical protein